MNSDYIVNGIKNHMQNAGNPKPMQILLMSQSP